MALSQKDVLHIAELADLALSPDEIERLTRDLAAVLQHVAQLEELDTSGVELTMHIGSSQMPLRASTPCLRPTHPRNAKQDQTMPRRRNPVEIKL